MPATSTVPDSPADVEAAALELIVRLPADILHTTAFTTVLQDYCGALRAEGTFVGLAWADAKAIAAAVSFDVISRDDAADFLRNRSRNALSGADNMEWENSVGAARALYTAATVLGL
jgi:hypothetical protein